MVKGLFFAFICLLVLGLFGWLKYKKDERIVTQVLRQFGHQGSDGFISTQAISSATQLSERRVRKVCRKSAVITNHREDEESWKISE